MANKIKFVFATVVDAIGEIECSVVQLWISLLSGSYQRLYDALPELIWCLTLSHFSSPVTSSPHRASRLTTRLLLSPSWMDRAPPMSRKCTTPGWPTQHRCMRWVFSSSRAVLSIFAVISLSSRLIARTRQTDLSIFDFVLVMGLLLPPQLVLSTSIVGPTPEKSRFCVDVYWRLVSPRIRRSWPSSHREPSWRQTDWRPFGCASYHQKLSGNKADAEVLVAALWASLQGAQFIEKHSGIRSVLFFIWAAKERKIWNCPTKHEISFRSKTNSYQVSHLGSSKSPRSTFSLAP